MCVLKGVTKTTVYTCIYYRMVRSHPSALPHARQEADLRRAAMEVEEKKREEQRMRLAGMPHPQGRGVGARDTGVHCKKAPTSLQHGC